MSNKAQKSKSKFKEITGDIWSFLGKDNTIIFVPTNGTLKNENELVMGRGLAKDAKDRFPQLSVVAGAAVKNMGNQVMFFADIGIGIIPTKSQWYFKSDIKLIEESLKQLLAIADKAAMKNIVIPRLGCGNGGLDWETQVKPILEKYLDNRFTVVTKE